MPANRRARHRLATTPFASKRASMPSMSARLRVPVRRYSDHWSLKSDTVPTLAWARPTTWDDSGGDVDQTMSKRRAAWRSMPIAIAGGIQLRCRSGNPRHCPSIWRRREGGRDAATLGRAPVASGESRGAGARWTVAPVASAAGTRSGVGSPPRSPGPVNTCTSSPAATHSRAIPRGRRAPTRPIGGQAQDTIRMRMTALSMQGRHAIREAVRSRTFGRSQGGCSQRGCWIYRE
jgi:hypothetical protein